jgi:hypothetical protein
MIGVLNFKSSLFDGILNNGEDSIFMGEDKFRTFMKTVEEITTAATTDVAANILIPADIEEEAEDMQQTTKIQGSSGRNSEALLLDFPDDDDVPSEEPEDVASKLVTTSDVPEPAALIAGGLNFLSGLARTFSSPEATQKLVSSLVDKDPSSGKTYLKIPVDNEKVVTDALNLFGQLFKAFGK